MDELLRIKGTREYDLMKIFENGSIQVFVNGQESNFRPEDVKRLMIAYQYASTGKKD